MLLCHPIVTLATLLTAGTGPEPGVPMGSVVRVQGSVQAVYQQGEDEIVSSLAAGDMVRSGQAIRTGSDGRAQLLLDDRSIVNLGSATELELSSLRRERGRGRVTVKLVVGSVWARVSRLLGRGAEFDLEGPNAVAGVRGTSFFVEVPEDQGETRVTVLRGRVELEDSAGRLLHVGALQQGVVLAGAPPVLRPVSPEQLEGQRQRLIILSASDLARMQRTWRLVHDGMDASWRGVALGEREKMRSVVLGAPGDAELPAPLLNVEPTASSAVVHGRVELQPAPP